MVSANQEKVAANKAADAQQQALDKIQPVSVSDVNTNVVDTETQNALAAKALQEKLNPGSTALQSQSIQSALASLSPDQYTEQIKKLIATQAGADTSGMINPDLLNAVIEQSKRDLALGGKLDAETQNQVMRAALAKAGGVTPGGLGLGRDISARDLGLTSLQLYNERLKNASAVGGQQLQMQGAQAAARNADINRTVAQAGILQAMQQGDWTKALAIAQWAQSLTPQVGLSGSDVANIDVGNVNQANAITQGTGTVQATKAKAAGAADSAVTGAAGGFLSTLVGGGGSNLYGLINQATPAASSGSQLTNFVGNSVQGIL